MLEEQNYFKLRGLLTAFKACSLSEALLSKDDLIFMIDAARDILSDVLNEPKE